MALCQYLEPWIRGAFVQLFETLLRPAPIAFGAETFAVNPWNTESGTVLALESLNPWIPMSSTGGHWVCYFSPSSILNRVHLPTLCPDT